MHNDAHIRAQPQRRISRETNPRSMLWLTFGWNDGLANSGFAPQYESLQDIDQTNYELGRLVATEAKTFAAAAGTCHPTFWPVGFPIPEAFYATVRNCEHLATICCPVPAGLRPQPFVDADTRRRAVDRATPSAIREELAHQAWLATKPRRRRR